MDIHKCIENFLGEMEKSMDLFGFGNQHSVIWDEHNNGGPLVSNSHESIQHAGSLRDSFLKSPNQSHHISKADIDLDGKIDIADVENLLNNKSEATAYDKGQTANYTPSVYSKSVYIRTVRHPDGSVETIRKVRDHTGNEETTITHDNLPASPYHPDLPGDDASGISIFRKFFSF
ncbi:hypothetical protein RUM44_003334 [Polyplax serrata]|uniref:EF-hand domain-containing protein n=1 Tax=Polyplax serrata TaxID=468196 RepID=A0ABR1AG62_POLSC